MNQLLNDEFLPLNGSEQHLRASKHLLSQVQVALVNSEKRDFAMHAELKNSGGLSRQQLEKKLTQVYGEPNEHQLFIARKTLEDNLNSVNSQLNITPRETFVVSNPV